MLTEFADGRYVAEEQTTIDTNSANSQQAMTLARLASGGLVATWLHNGTIVAQLHDSSGARIGAEFSIAFSSQFSPAIGLASGGFVIGWIGVDANGWGAKAKMFDAAGTATSGVINLNQNAPGNQTALTLTALTTGGFAAAWQEYDANFINAGIEARVFNASGVAVTGDISVAASGGNATPTIAALADGNFAVAYSGGTSFAGSVPSNINARVFDLAGNPTGTTFTTNGITAHAKAGNPKLALLSSGDLVLGWVGSNNGTPVEVLTQRFSAAGARVGDAVSVSTAVGAGTSIAVTTTDAGFAVAFGKAIGTDPFNSSAKQTDIAVQLFDTSGTRLGSDFIVNAPSQSEQSKPSIVQFGSGDLAVAFTDYGSDSNGDVSFRLLFDPIIGTSANDTLSGSASADKIDGRAGDDTLNGGAGNDELDGGDGDDTLFGGAGSDQLYGGSGNDILDGGEGADRMSGGIGDDSYYVDNASDVVAENAGAGDDIVYSTVSFVLSDNVEALRLLGSTSINATGNAQNNRLVGNDGNNLLTGGTGDDYLQAGAGDDKLYGEDGNDTLEGGAGDDQLIGGAGNDVLDGGSGLDTAVFSGLFRSYAVNVKGGNGTVSGAKEGTDSLTSIEFLQFKDGKFVFDADGVSAQVTRLYDTVLNRAPDQAGLDLWVDQIEDRGATLKDVARAFLNSAEFQAKTGNLSNADYVEFLYQNALGRASDPGGKAAWVNQLNNGADRADLLIGFSESPEHRGLTAELVSKGFFNTDDAYQAVALLYDSFAGRLPDAGGLVNWAEALKSGAMTLAQVASGFANSAEFQNLTSGMSHSQLVDFMYQTSLDRGADSGGKAGWVNALDAGMSDGDLLIGFSQSTEHFFLLGSHITNGIDYF